MSEKNYCLTQNQAKELLKDFLEKNFKFSPTQLEDLLKEVKPQLTNNIPSWGIEYSGKEFIKPMFFCVTIASVCSSCYQENTTIEEIQDFCKKERYFFNSNGKGKPDTQAYYVARNNVYRACTYP